MPSERELVSAKKGLRDEAWFIAKNIGSWATQPRRFKAALLSHVNAIKHLLKMYPQFRKKFFGWLVLMVPVLLVMAVGSVLRALGDKCFRMFQRARKKVA